MVAGAAVARTDRVVGVTDGETIKVLCDRTAVKVRLTEIDEPEGGPVWCEGESRAVGSGLRAPGSPRLHRYGRSIARVWVGSRDTNREMIRRGYAWACRKYLTDTSLLDDEAFAR